MSITGFIAAGFEPVREAFEQNFADGLEQGASFAAYLGDELVVDLRGGFADRAGDVAWNETHAVPGLFGDQADRARWSSRCSSSAGKLDYDAPVADYWPEFAANGKGAVTVAEALSHQAGVPGFPDPIDPALWLDPPALVGRAREAGADVGQGRGLGLSSADLGLYRGRAGAARRRSGRWGRSCARISVRRWASISGSACRKASMAAVAETAEAEGARRSFRTRTPRRARLS